MHELAVTQNLLELALAHAAGRRIGALTVVIGDLASMVDDSVAFYWDLISQGTVADGARLHFRRVPATLSCEACQTTYQLEPGELLCPECGSARVRVLSGTEFYLESLEVEAPTAEVPQVEAPEAARVALAGAAPAREGR